MKDRRKNKTKRKVLLALYLAVCLVIIVAAYFHLSRIARNFNTEHLELITGLYAEKMNDSMEYLQNYVQEDIKMIRSMENAQPEEILEQLEKNLDKTVFGDIGFIMNDGEIYGSSSCAVSDIKKKQLDEAALASDTSFNSDPYQSSRTGNMTMTVFVPVGDTSLVHTLYVSIMIENLRQLGEYELLQGKISIHLLKADSENFITCVSDNSGTSGSWNNLLLQQKYFQYDVGYSYNQWIKDMRSGKKDGRFSAIIRGEESTISYRSISVMPGWYVIVELTNKNISDITQQFSAWGGVYGSILVGFTMLYMLTIVLLEKKDKKMYMGLSTTDSLTGILNRRAFQIAVEEELRGKTPGVFIFIDVDNFKIYNDTYGHNNGDFCLKHFAKTMKSCFPEDSIIGRYGGDEFVVMLRYINSQKEAEQIAAKIVDVVKKKENLTIPETISVSIGMAFFNDEKNCSELFSKADEALYISKKAGKGCFSVYGRKYDSEIVTGAEHKVLIWSASRNIISTLEYELPHTVSTDSVASIEDIREYFDAKENNVMAIYVDFSDYPYDGKELWDILKKETWLKKCPIIAICKEGNINQIKYAVNSGIIMDLMLAPLEVPQLKRRINEYMSYYKISQEEKDEQ